MKQRDHCPTLTHHNCWVRTPLSPPLCGTFRRVVVSLRGPGQSPIRPFACCVGSLCSVGRCSRCSCWCRFRVRGAPPPDRWSTFGQATFLGFDMARTTKGQRVSGSPGGPPPAVRGVFRPFPQRCLPHHSPWVGVQVAPEGPLAGGMGMRPWYLVVRNRRRPSASRHRYHRSLLSQSVLWLCQWNPRTCPVSRLRPPLATGPSRQASLANRWPDRIQRRHYTARGPAPAPSAPGPDRPLPPPPPRAGRSSHGVPQGTHTAVVGVAASVSGGRRWACGGVLAVVTAMFYLQDHVPPPPPSQDYSPLHPIQDHIPLLPPINTTSLPSPTKPTSLLQGPEIPGTAGNRPPNNAPEEKWENGKNGGK